VAAQGGPPRQDGDVARRDPRAPARDQEPARAP
jgi:hypothetical protein